MKFSNVAGALSRWERGLAKALLLILIFSPATAFAQTTSRVDITADSTIIIVGEQITATARAKDADGVIIPNVALTWATRTPAVATVDLSGIVTGLFPGTVQITARTAGNVTGTLTFTVVPARVEVSGSSTVVLNRSMSVTARALDIRSNSIPSVTIAWASDNTSVATVTATGLVQAVGLGEAVISATVSGYAGRLAVTVQRPMDYSVQAVVASDSTNGPQSRIQTITSISNLNSRGDIAFVGNLSGSTAAVILDAQGQLTALARTGEPAPLGGVFSGFGQPVVNNRGEVAFTATVASGIGPLLMLARGRNLFVLLAVGDTLEFSGNISTITLASDGLDDSGYATVTLALTNPSYFGVFRVSPEQALEPLLRSYDELSIGLPTAINSVSVAPNGKTAVFASSGTRRGIYLVSPAGAEAVAVDGAAAPGGGVFTSFQTIRATDTGLFFTATPQGGTLSLYRSSGPTLEQVVRGGRDTTSNRTTTIAALFGANGNSVVLSATLSDIGTGIFLWTGGSLQPAALRTAAMPGGEILSRLDNAWVNATQDVALLALTDRHLSALYRIRGAEKSLAWASGSATPIPANFYLVTTTTLRPGPNINYFMAGSPAGLFRTSNGIVTPVAIPGQISPRGDAFTVVNVASSNANGDLVFAATSINLRTAVTTIIMYRYMDGALVEWFPFNVATDFPGLGRQTISSAGLNGIGINAYRQVAFVGAISGRTSLFFSTGDFRILLQNGSPSPSGGTFTNFSSVQVTPSGTVVFIATMTGGPAGLFAHSGSAVPIALATEYTGIGAPSPGGESIYFSARRGDVTALWVYSNGATRPFVAVGAALPTNATVTGIGAYSAQEDGSVVFQATSAYTGVFMRAADDTISTVALLTETTPIAGRYSTFLSLTVGNSVVQMNTLVTTDRAALFVGYPDTVQRTPITSTDFTILNRGTVSARTGGRAATQTIGYASVLPGPGSTTPSALAILAYRQNNALVSETTVPAVSLIQNGRIYAEVGGSVNTGIAIANPGAQTASVSFYFTDLNGEDFRSGTIPVEAGRQIVGFLNDSPFNGGSPIIGTFTFSSSVPLAVIAIRGYTNERSEFLMTTLPVIPLPQTDSSAVILPHFAEGGGWTTRILLVNPTDGPVSGAVNFTGQGTPAAPAQPLFVTIGGQTNSTFPYSLPKRSSRVLETSGAGALRSGWVRITGSAGGATASGMVIFSYKQNGITVSEAGVPSSPSATAFRLYLEASGSISTGQIGTIQTGIAIANPSNAPATVTFDLSNLSGASAGITGSAVVPAQGQIAVFANDITNFQGVTANQGVLRISSPAAIAVIGIRARVNERGEFLTTTVHPVAESSIPSTTGLFMPHFVESGGFTTQFILFSGSANQSSSGSLRFFNQSGQSQGLTLR